MSNKFSSVPKERDTKILFQLEAKLGELDVLYQKWFYDGIYAESLIFTNEDVENIDEETLIKEVVSSPLFEENSSTTFKKSDFGFTFVNFNFKMED